MEKRNSGLDLCRILSMLGIVVLHVIGKGGAQQTIDGLYTPQYWVTEWLFICALCSVEVFAIMSGYLGINKRTPSLYRTFDLISIVVFFCVIVTACFVIISPNEFLGIKPIIKGLFPPLFGRYWYIVNFIPVLVLQPFLNKMILSLSEKQHKYLCIVSFSVFTIIPAVTMVDFFKFSKGYSFIWLLLLYILGAYLKRERIDSYVIPSKYLVISFFGMSAILLFGNIFISTVLNINYRYFVNYDSPVILLMSLSFFLMLKKLNIKKVSGLLKQLSLSAFDVYIVHGHILIFDYIIMNAFVKTSNMSVYIVIPMILLYSVVIYVISTVLGLARIKLFEITGINKLLQKISKPIDKIVYSDTFDNN